MFFRFRFLWSASVLEEGNFARRDVESLLFGLSKIRALIYCKLRIVDKGVCYVIILCCMLVEIMSGRREARWNEVFPDLKAKPDFQSQQ